MMRSATGSTSGSRSSPPASTGEPKCLASVFGARDRAVQQHDGAEPRVDQRLQDGARGAARADHQRRPSAPPVGRAFIEIGGEAVDVGVVAVQAAMLEPQRVDGLQSTGDRRRDGAGAERRLLVR